MRQIIHFDNMGAIGSYDVDSTHGITNIPQNAWTSSENVRFVDNQIFPMREDTAVLVSTSLIPNTPHNVIAINAETSYSYQTMFVFADAGNGLRSSVKIENPAAGPMFGARTSYSATVSARHSYPPYLSIFNGVVVGSGKGFPWQIGEGLSSTALSYSTNGTILPSWSYTAGVKCRFIKPFKNYLVAAGVQKDGYRGQNILQWSHPAAIGSIPDSWDYGDPAKDAGKVEIGGGDDAIVDAVVLGDRMMIYKQKSVWSMEYIGAPNIFKFDRVFSDVGAVKIGAAINIDDSRHLVVGYDDIYIHDGVSKTSVFPEKIRDRFFRNVTTNLDKDANSIMLWKDEKESEIYINYSKDAPWGYSNRALVWNYKSNTYYTRTYQSEVSGQVAHGKMFIGSFDEESLNYYGCNNIAHSVKSNTAKNKQTYVYLIDMSAKDGLQNTYYQPGTVTKRNLPLGRQLADGTIKNDSRIYKTIYSVYPHIEISSSSTTTMSVSILTRNNLNGDDITTSYQFKTSQEKVDVRQSGRFIGIKFGWRQNTSAARPRLSGFSLDVDLEGDR